MILGIGCDLVLMSRIKKIWLCHPERFMKRVFHPIEQTYILSHQHNITTLAGHFAAKEAGLKALGTGKIANFRWTDIYVDHNKHGKPQLMLQGTIHQYLMTHKLIPNTQAYWHLSLTHDGDYAQAFAVLESFGHDYR